MPQNNFWGCKLPDFHLLTGKTPFLRLLEKIQSPYTLLAAFPRTWYNREESHLGQLEFFSGCSFLIALNMILHLRIISYTYLLNILIFLYSLGNLWIGTYYHLNNQTGYCENG